MQPPERCASGSELEGPRGAPPRSPARWARDTCIEPTRCATRSSEICCAGTIGMVRSALIAAIAAVSLERSIFEICSKVCAVYLAQRRELPSAGRNELGEGADVRGHESTRGV